MRFGRSIFLAFVSLLCAVMPTSVFAASVRIDATAAFATLDALQNPHLTRQESLRIAEMPGNQGVLRKAREFKFAATTQSFADALYDASRGIPLGSKTEACFLFELVRPKVPVLLSLVKQIADHPEAFQQQVQDRIAQFSPPGLKLQLQGYVVAAGDGGGYAFGSTDFYLNIGIMDEFIVAKTTTAHELYHAVQGAFAKDRGTSGDLPDLIGLRLEQQACLKTKQLFANIYEEGSAMYVEDITLLKGSQSQIGKRQQADLNDGIAHAQTSASLLEMSVIALEANPGMAYDDVYDVGFYGHAVLYNISYMMAKGIAEQDGPQGLAAYLQRPPTAFARRYTQLERYGKDKDHPLLGRNTLNALNRWPSSCPR